MAVPFKLGLALFACSAGTSFGFVNIPPVRKPALQSTSTFVTWEPAHVLTEIFSRNPFVDEEENTQSTANSMTTTDGSELTYDTTNSRRRADLQRSIRKSWIAQERLKRTYQRKMKVRTHNFLRDTGLLRTIADFLVTMGVPSMAMENPEIIPRFLRLTRDCQRIPYGEHEMQGIDMFFPEGEEKARGLLFFVHGGAWGSGQTWQYRLVAQPFLEQGMAVAVVGYRTFPDGDMNDQVKDLEMASQKLTELYPDLCRKESDLGCCVMGHSSGGHIAMSMIANRLQRQLRQPTETGDADRMRIDSFFGLSAPYEISSHFEFETGRGLEELSPMLAACGYDREHLSDYSPVLNLFRTMISKPQQECARVNEACPSIFLIHGDQDHVVPLSSTQQAAQLLALGGITKCQDIVLSETGHSETVLELMFGGKTQDAVMDRLLKARVASRAEDVVIHGHQRVQDERALEAEPSIVG